jgi:hypothetical protein
MNQWVGVLLLLGFIVAYFWWVVAIIAPIAVAWWGYRLWQQHCAARDAAAAERMAIRARADQQHAQVLEGDDRGIYGEFPPAV